MGGWVGGWGEWTRKWKPRQCLSVHSNDKCVEKIRSDYTLKSTVLCLLPFTSPPNCKHFKRFSNSRLARDNEVSGLSTSWCYCDDC